jgi:diguanylate cyclase (GGDEF)-like protein
MRRHTQARERTARLFALYAAITLIPVLLLGVVLAVTFRAETNRSGLAEGRAEAVQIARTAVEPLLPVSNRPLSRGLNATERTELQRLANEAKGQSEGEFLRLRIRDLNAQVVWSSDPGTKANSDDDEALEAAHGQVVSHLTTLNADDDHTGGAGPAAVEVYLPLHGGTPRHRVGVLELYVPYAPIGASLTAGLHSLYRDLAVGLGSLYLILFAITASVSRGLRRQWKFNAFLAHTDTLTNLPNRTTFHEEGTRALLNSRRARTPLAIGLIDLDHFKQVNDALGHPNGDRLLIEVGRRLATAVPGNGMVARLGGDEFGVILRNERNPERAFAQIRDVINEDVNLDGLPLSVQASLGYVLAAEDGDDLDTLLQRADLAMYAAKFRHAGVLRYDSAFDHYDAAQLTLIGELRHAIDDGQLVLHYQPQSLLDDGRVVAVEALVRWQHPIHGLLYPDKFLPLAEQTDVIDKLTTWVIETALSEISNLGASPPNLNVSVNVSARSIGRVEIAQEVVDTLERIGVPPERLTIEVTETALLVDPARAAAVLRRLALAGVRISLDDFGQGQTSLGYLSELPIHELKIDKSFVIDMLENDAHAAIVRSIIDLGHNLNLQVIAEGIETVDVLASLQAARCDLAQGYFIARPMPPDRLVDWMPAQTQHASPVR